MIREEIAERRLLAENAGKVEHRGQERSGEGVRQRESWKGGGSREQPRLFSHLLRLFTHTNFEGLLTRHIILTKDIKQRQGYVDHYGICMTG